MCTIKFPITILLFEYSCRVCRYIYIRSKGKCLNDRDEDSNTALHLAGELVDDIFSR